MYHGLAALMLKGQPDTEARYKLPFWAEMVIFAAIFVPSFLYAVALVVFLRWDFNRGDPRILVLLQVPFLLSVWVTRRVTRWVEKRPKPPVDEAVQRRIDELRDTRL